jgi:hypothetical protein
MLVSSRFFQVLAMLILCGAMAAPLLASRLPEIEVAPADLDFGAVPVRETSLGSVTISNIGNGILAVSDVRLLPGSSRGFTLAQPLTVPFKLSSETDGSVGQAQSIGIAFTPLSAGSHTALLEIVTSGAAVEVTRVALSGQGLESPVRPQTAGSVARASAPAMD